VNLIELAKIDCHCHVLDPQRFAYPTQVAYKPQGQEIGTADYFTQVMQAYGVRHALLVGPNSGYGTDNRCLLDAIARGQGRFKGVAVVDNQAGRQELQALQQQGIVGIAFNPSLLGNEAYDAIDPLLERLQSLGLWAQFQVSADQLVHWLPRIRHTGVRTLIDHCGRPELADGPQASGVQALLELATDGCSVIKLSGFAKFSKLGFPFEDTQAHVMALLDAFGPERCVWASDWPFLRAPSRLDYGTLLMLAQRWFTPQQCRQMMWDAPQRLFGW